VLGSKVALSLNVDSFRVINRYNGKKFKFDVYLDKVDPVTPKISGGKVNEYLQLTDDCIAYYEETSEKNGLEVQVEIKKHNKKLLFEAIQSQLMYLPNIKVYTKAQGALSYTNVDIAAKELYRDDDIIISESTVYDKPHVLLGTGKALINYGFIAFNELEIEPKRGAVGFILSVNDVEVTPSREALVWSPKTRKAVLEAYDRVSLTAAKFVNDSLSSETDYMEWMVKAAQTMSALKNGNNSSVIGRLASIIDASAITNVRYPLNTQVEYSTKVIEMIGNKLMARRVIYDRYTHKIERGNIAGVDAFALPVYFSEGKADMYVDRYLSDTVGAFVLIQPKDEFYKADLFAKLVLSSAKILKYSDVKVPDDTMEAYLAGELDSGGDPDDSSNTIIDRGAIRKANAQIVVHKINKSYNNYVFSAYDTNISNIPSLYDPSKVVIYGTSNDRSDMKNIANQFPHGYLSCHNDWRGDKDSLDDNGVPNYTCFNPNAKPIEMVLIAKDNEKYFMNSPKYKTLNEFVVKSYDSNSGKLVFGDDIKAAATASVINKLFAEYNAQSILLPEVVENIFPDEHVALVKITKGWFDRSYAYNTSTMDTVFFGDCIQLQLGAEGILSMEDPTDILKIINSSVPDYLCDTVDHISSVDILLIDEVNYWRDFFGKTKDYLALIELYSRKYFYDKTEELILGAQIKEYIDLKV